MQPPNASWGSPHPRVFQARRRMEAGRPRADAVSAPSGPRPRHRALQSRLPNPLPPLTRRTTIGGPIVVERLPYRPDPFPDEHFPIALAKTSSFHRREPNPSRFGRTGDRGRSSEGAGAICFPECFVPGYRTIAGACRRPTWYFSSARGRRSPRPRQRRRSAVVLGTERIVDGGLLISALVINADGRSPVSRTRCSSIPPRIRCTRRADRRVFKRHR